MKTKFFIPLLFVAGSFAACSSGTKDGSSYRSSSDTTSSAEGPPPATDTLLKDTSMKDSTSTSADSEGTRGGSSR